MSEGPTSIMEDLVASRNHDQQVVASKLIIDSLTESLSSMHDAKMMLQQYELLHEDYPNAAKLTFDICTTTKSLAGMIRETQRRLGNG